MVYKWNFPNVPVDAQAAGELFAELEKTHGALTPALVVDESRAEDALLHPCFEWDDFQAAELYRQKQAGALIRNIRVVVEEVDTQPARDIHAYVNVKPADKPRSYVSISVAMNDADLRQQVLTNAYNELCAFRAKYETYSELQGVFSAIDELKPTFNKKE